MLQIWEDGKGGILEKEIEVVRSRFLPINARSLIPARIVPTTDGDSPLPQNPPQARPHDSGGSAASIRSAALLCRGPPVGGA